MENDSSRQSLPMRFNDGMFAIRDRLRYEAKELEKNNNDKSAARLKECAEWIDLLL